MTDSFLTCELCGLKGMMNPFFEAIGIVQCPQCRLVFFDPATYSPGLYGADYFHGGEYTDYRGDRPLLEWNFSRRIRELRALSPRGRLLEIGSAYGFFLNLARPYWQARGLDVSPEAVRHARDTLHLDVQEADFLTLPDELESYDVICLWDTLEHLPQPVRLLEKAARWLRPGGLLALTTGDIGSPLARLQKERWRLVHPPTHLFYFSEDTLHRAIEKAGLRPVRSRSVGYWRSWKSMMNELFMRGPRLREWMYQGLTFGGRLNFPVYLNLFDIRMMVARKPKEPLASIAKL